MKDVFRKLVLVVGAMAAFAFLPTRAEAQSPYSPMFWSFEGGVGMAMPMGEIADAAEAGPSFSGAASYFLRPRLALRVEGALDMLGTKGAIDPNFQIFHLTGGIEYHLTDPMGSATVAVDFGLGASTLDSDAFLLQNHPMPGLHTVALVNGSYFSGNAGIKAGLNFARHADTGVPMVTLFAQADLRYVMTDEEETHVYGELNNVHGFSSIMEIPLSVGLRVNFP
ncbi:MAG: hypothetical protein F4X22_04945 [Gemmatimonadales bacterium]|nr:hypothetical protein [Candidatus Palauibacter denitrificans]